MASSLPGVGRWQAALGKLLIPFSVLVAGPSALAQEEEPEVIDISGAPPSLKTVESPLPPKLFDFVKDFDAAVKLGKAFYWDVQVGSDGMTACATCHYHAGTNNRFKNTLHPGGNGTFELGGPLYELKAGDFPFFRLLDPADAESMIINDTDEVVGAAGVHLRDLTAVAPGVPVDMGDHVDDPVFNLAGENTRQVTGRQVPTNIGAVFIHRLFWDGRANNKFNGVNIWGDQDPDAMIWCRDDVTGAMVQVRCLLKDAALASQALAPPVSFVEMSWNLRTWPMIGRKMIPMPPLAMQTVDPTDSALADCANPGGLGLLPGITYESMIMDAFHEKWYTGTGTDPDGFDHMEANFSLFWGIALLCYQSLLRGDDTLYDRFMEDPTNPANAFSQQQLEGLDIFLNRGGCFDCHAGSEFAGAALSVLRAPPEIDPETGLPVPPEGLLERMPMENTGSIGEIAFATVPTEPGVLPLTFPAMNQLVRIMPLGSGPTGLPLATGFVANPGVPIPPDGVLDFRLAMNPIGVPEEVLNDVFVPFEAEVRFRSDGCNEELIIEMGWGFPGLPAGDYPVVVGVTQVGVISMPAANPPAVYDNGFYNIGVRPTEDDIGLAADGPFGPLSLAARAQMGYDICEPQGIIPPVAPGERLATRGAFRAVTVRNIWLTAPYMHNGGQSVLEHVVEFYSRGVDFLEANIDDVDPEVAGIGGMDRARKVALVAFMKTLTDFRVLVEAGPYDHPSLPLKHGQILAGGADEAIDVVEIIPATGAAGGPPLKPFHERLAAWVTCYPLTGVVAHETPLEVPPALCPLPPPAVGPNQFTMVLDKPPTELVRIKLRTDVPAQATVTPTTLFFGPTDWDIPQVVTVNGVKDKVADGDCVVKVLAGPAISLDVEYAGLPIQEVEVTVIDDGVGLPVKPPIPGFNAGKVPRLQPTPQGR